MRRVLAVALAVLCAVLLVSAGTAPASAHASLVSTDPADGSVLPVAPESVTFTFDEPVSLVADGIAIFDAAGEPVDAESRARDKVVTADLPRDLDDGTYVLAWRVVSTDGHPIAGSLTFSIGARSPEVVAPPSDSATADDTGMGTGMGLLQAVGYLALLLAAGLVVFLGWTVRGVELPAKPAALLRWIQWAAAGTAVTVFTVLVPAAGAYQQGLGWSGLLDTAAYDLTLVGENATVVVLQLVGFTLVLLGRRDPQPVLAVLGAALASWSPALVGHTRGYQPTSLLVLTDALHLSAGAVWLGGLVGLTLVLGPLSGRPTAAAVLVSRFSTLGAVLLGGVAVTGTVMWWRILGAWAPLVDTTYGRLLLIKAGLAGLVALVAAWNHFRLVPRVVDDSAGHEARRRAVRTVRTQVRREAVGLVAVLILTGLLVERSPSGEPGRVGGSVVESGTGAVTGSAEGYRVVAVLDGAPGRNRQLTVQVQDDAGEPVDIYGAPRVSLRSADINLGEVPVSPVASGTYRADVVFPSLGRWQVQVSLAVDRFTSPVTTVDLDVE